MAEEEDDAPGVPEWVVTYGDMMSLLLTFFIMLVSMSEIRSDKGKARRMMDGIREAFGPTKFKRGAPGRSLQESSMLSKLYSKSGASRGGTEKGGQDSKGPSGDHHSVRRLRNGTQIVLGGNARFQRFDARLSDGLKRDLDVIADVVRKKPNSIMIRGHATPEPLPEDRQLAAAAFGGSLGWPARSASLQTHDGQPIRDQMDLSFARARAVANYLISRKIDRKRIIVTAAGDAEIRLKTRSRKKQRWNRRVDVFLLDTYISPPPGSK